MYFEKQPREETTVAINASGWREMQRGERLISAIVSVTLEGAPIEGIYVSHYIKDATIYVRFKGGVRGQNYKVVVLGETHTGHVREVDLIMGVVEK